VDDHGIEIRSSRNEREWPGSTNHIMYSFPFLKIKAQQKNLCDLQSICDSTSFSILEHANLRKAVALSFHKACSLLQKKNYSHKEEREKMFVYSYIFSTLAAHFQRAGLVTSDSIRDKRQSKEVNLQ
jgi:hypothetical protein